MIEGPAFGETLKSVVAGRGFEPLKAMPSDLQSDSFGHSDNLPSLQGSSQKGYLTGRSRDQPPRSITVTTQSPFVPRETCMNVWSQANRIGLAMTMLIGAANVLFAVANLPTILDGPAAATVGPPPGVMLAVGVLGAVMLLAAGYAWLKVSRRGATIASVGNILQGLTTLPAFFQAPAVWQVIAGVTLAWTAVSVALTLSKSKGSAPVE